MPKGRQKEAVGVPAREGLLFIISAPSGAGKSTLCRAVLDRFADLQYSISYTTRQPRNGEQNGVDYYFIADDEFEKGIARNRWAEWAKVHGNYYGTAADFIDRGLADHHASAAMVQHLDLGGNSIIKLGNWGMNALPILPTSLSPYFLPQ